MTAVLTTLGIGARPSAGAVGSHRKRLDAQLRQADGAGCLRCSAAQLCRQQRRRSACAAGRAIFSASAGPVVLTAAVPPPPPAKKNAFSVAMSKLREYGLAGVLSYGLLNTAYYSIAFLLVWITVIKAPTGMGLQTAARKFLETFAIVWAGSQVTKAVRAGGAVLLAPLVDRMLVRIQEWMNTQRSIYDPMATKGEAFRAVLGVCLLFALGLFAVVVLRWAV